jgi:hypothetical protein
MISMGCSGKKIKIKSRIFVGIVKFRIPGSMTDSGSYAGRFPHRFLVHVRGMWKKMCFSHRSGESDVGPLIYCAVLTA